MYVTRSSTVLSTATVAKDPSPSLLILCPLNEALLHRHQCREERKIPFFAQIVKYGCIVSLLTAQRCAL